MAGTLKVGGKVLATHNSETDEINYGDVGISSGTTLNRPSSPVVGQYYYNTTLNRIEMFVGQSQWMTVHNRYQWIHPIASNRNNGIISNDGQRWWCNYQVATSYGAVILNRIFPGDFTVVASWQQDFRGIGMVYKDNASLDDFTGDVIGGDQNGPYWGSLAYTGFGNASPAYSFFGQYYAPITGDTASTFYYFKWQRSGNTLTLQYSATSATGPWTNFNTYYTATCSTSNEVIIGAGEADSGEIKPLTLISVVEG